MFVNRQLRAIADKQWGYFTAHQALGAGYINPVQTYHVKQGNWSKIDRALYRLNGYEDNRESNLTRWALWAAGSSLTRFVAVSHESALHYYGLRSEMPLQVHLSVSSVRSGGGNEACVLHLEDVPREDTQQHQGFRIVSPALALRQMRPDLTLERCWVDTIRTSFQRALIDWNQMQELLGTAPEHVVPVLVRNSAPPLETAPPSGSSPEDETLTGRPGESRPERMLRSRGSWMAPNRSFTLVEMLVVIAIIAILAGLLMPSLNSALRAVRATACTNNLRGLSILQSQYMDDNGDSFCPVRGDANSWRMWTYFLYPYTAGSQTIPWPGWEHNSYRSSKLANMPLNLNVCPEAEQLCLMSPSGADWNSGGSFGMSGYFGPDYSPTTTMSMHSPIIRKRTRIPAPGMAALMADLYQPLTNFAFWFYYWDWDPSTRYCYPHANNRNVLYVDGHAGAYPGLWPANHTSAPGKAFYTGVP